VTPGREILEADLTWMGERFEPGVRVTVDNGRIAAVDAAPEDGSRHEPVRRLHRRALLPGLVSAHSHAFQRGLRGRGQRFPDGAGDFWSWREAMYALVERLDGDEFRTFCVQTFGEMRDAGVTAVGEFHYLHHGVDGDDFAFDDLVLEAAAEAGIRIVLLQTHYRTGGFGRPLAYAQRRFDTRSTEAFLASLDRLAERVDPSTQSVGIAAHSVRAVPIDEISTLAEVAAARRLPFHLHVEERQKEIEACLAAHGARPMELLLDRLERYDGVVAVHGTHTDGRDMARFLEAGGRLCVCPLTEADLGDGIPALATVGEIGSRLSIGTDQNARIAMSEEMRWLEYGQRLARGRRGLLVRDGDAARALLTIATEGGAEALGLDPGRIAPGAPADLMVLDLDAPALMHVSPDDLLAAWIFGCGNDAVAATCVAGRWRESGRG